MVLPSEPTGGRGDSPPKGPEGRCHRAPRTVLIRDGGRTAAVSVNPLALGVHSRTDQADNLDPGQWGVH